MPTFTAIALDRMIDPVVSKMAASTRSVPQGTPLDRRNSMPSRTNPGEETSRPVPVPRRPSIPPPRPPLVRRNSIASSPTTVASETSFERKPPQWPQISPALYATPETTPLPDSPTSYPPSPYIINHKRRGPRLQKSSSDASVLTEKHLDEKLGNGRLGDIEVDSKASCSDGVAGTTNFVEEEKPNSSHEGQSVNVIENVFVGGENGEHKEVPAVSSGLVEIERDVDDVLEPHEGLTPNTDGEDVIGERSARFTTPNGEFFDAWEELSSDSGCQPQTSSYDVEAELREMKLSLLMEIEQRRQAEEVVSNMQTQWQLLVRKLREVDIVPPFMDDDVVLDATFIEEICRQVNIARYVSESVGKGTAKAEFEEEMEAQLEWKDFEIARLCDRLHYYETMNREMSQRNQETIELARRHRQRRRRIKKWIWRSVATTVTIGAAALAWSLMPSSKVSCPSSSSQVQSSESNSLIQPQNDG